MEPAEPTIHRIPDGVEPSTFVDSFTSRADTGQGVTVVVLVTADGNVAYARVHDEGSAGHESQRWLEHARRGSSPGGWSQLHDARSEEHVGAWKQAAAQPLDRLLIACSKRAWKLDAEPPYVAEFPAATLADCGI